MRRLPNVSPRSVWSAAAAVVAALLFAGAILVYTATERDEIRAENRATLVLFICATVELGKNFPLVDRFLVILDDIGERCEP